MLKAFSNSTRSVAAMTALVALGGCRAHDLGVGYSDKLAPRVDNSWLVATSRCWPELRGSGFTLGDIKRLLGDPLHFRAVFATYSAQSDASLREIVGVPVMKAPAPDSSVLNSEPNPVLTRAEAMTGSNPEGTLISMTNGIAPADALCAVQHGVPVGFR